MEKKSQSPAAIPSKNGALDAQDLKSAMATIVLSLVALFLAPYAVNHYRLKGSEWDQMVRIAEQDREPATAEHLSEASRQSNCVASKLQQSLNDQIVITKGHIKTFRFVCSSAAQSSSAG
jgi:hypothetical protein